MAGAYLDGRRYDLALSSARAFAAAEGTAKNWEPAGNIAFHQSSLQQRLLRRTFSEGGPLTRPCEDRRAVAGGGEPLTRPGQILVIHPGKQRRGPRSAPHSGVHQENKKIFHGRGDDVQPDYGGRKRRLPQEGEAGSDGVQP